MKKKNQKKEQKLIEKFSRRRRRRRRRRRFIKNFRVSTKRPGVGVRPLPAARGSRKYLCKPFATADYDDYDCRYYCIILFAEIRQCNLRRVRSVHECVRRIFTIISTTCVQKHNGQF